MIKTFIKKQTDKIFEEANLEAEKIIKNAKEERSKILSEEALLAAVRDEADRLRRKVTDECKEIKENTKKLQEKILKEDNTIYSIYKYGSVRYLNFDLWSVSDIKTYKAGIIDINGNQIIPCMFDEIPGILEGTDCLLVMNFRPTCYGLVDKKGNILIEPKFSDFNSGFRNGLWAVKLNDKWGYVDKNGNTVIPFEYDKASPFHDDRAEVELDNEKFYIDKFNEKIGK